MTDSYSDNFSYPDGHMSAKRMQEKWKVLPSPATPDGEILQELKDQ